MIDKVADDNLHCGGRGCELANEFCASWISDRNVGRYYFAGVHKDGGA